MLRFLLLPLLAALGGCAVYPAPVAYRPRPYYAPPPPVYVAPPPPPVYVVPRPYYGWRRW